ncbi:hypothetical protein ACFPOD_17875 [Nitratireductor kimnyeongensis]|uniref:Thiamine-phosphate pyrophosphorylase n=1 Tax=Nitratireductor kimnyeongensis TaxID=430679 RepID=A0ABW0TCU6_9HYPH|nr:hypothetical protein [Nitratireductor kimnyeongensis]
MPNESEFFLLSGMPTGTEDEILAAARSLIEKGICTIIVTPGRGAHVSSPQIDLLPSSRFV